VGLVALDDITSAVHAGSNQIVVQVTNLWVKRMIGDRQAWARGF
jgi:hypothetical protein